jgi:putative PIG3 family NAD(P)H quinone oxidoreductase
MTTGLTRRRFVKRSAAVGGGLALATPLATFATRTGEGHGRPCVLGYGELFETPEQDSGIAYLRLPEGFGYRVISRSGEPMSDGNPTPNMFDGMAAYQGRHGTTVLIRNHEHRSQAGVRPPAARRRLRGEGASMAAELDSAAMRAATIRDGEIRVEQHPDPVPGTGELLVRVRGAGINGADMMQRRGLYPAPPGSPADIPGLELAGEVVSRGAGAERFAEGDRVMAIVGGGGQAELAVVHERIAMPVPDALDWPAAGGFAEVFTTAHDALFTQARLGAGERLLVHGGAGGVGTAAIQLATSAGARVTATVRNPDLRDEVAALGAEAIDPEGFAEHGPFDVVLELVGAPNLVANLDALATSGRIVVIGVGAGATAELNLLALMVKRARIQASTLRARPLEEKAATARALERHVLPLVAAGSLRVPVAATYALDEAPAAYERFAAGGKLGKIVLLP